MKKIFLLTLTILFLFVPISFKGLEKIDLDKFDSLSNTRYNSIKDYESLDNNQLTKSFNSLQEANLFLYENQGIELHSSIIKTTVELKLDSKNIYQIKLTT